MMEAETGVMLLEARGARVPGSQQHQEEAREDFSLEASEGAQPSQHLHFRLLAFRTVRINFCFQPPVCATLLQQP